MNTAYDILVADPSARVRERVVALCRELPGVREVQWTSSPELMLRRLERSPPGVLIANAVFLRELSGHAEGPPRIALYPAGRRPAPHVARHAVALLDTDVPAARERFAKELEVAVREVLTRRTISPPSAPRVSPPAPASVRGRRGVSVGSCLIAIGASTGGTVAIEHVLTRLSGDGPPVLIAQHISEGFSGPLARRLNSVCKVRVLEAEEEMLLERAHVYLAPSRRHLAVGVIGGNYCCRLSSSERVNRHRPSVDYLFASVAKVVHGAAVGILLTGMGRDGAEGLLAMHRAGSATIVQDQATSVVWGMPGAAHALGAAQSVLSLDDIAERVASLYAAKR